ncbi:MAG: hypothetical protein AABY22_10610 [Nanoarchaeota archaeon]
MKIPKKLKVGGHEYTIRITPVTDKAKGSNNWGRTYHATQEILIDKELSITKQEETFVHEIVHCIESFMESNSKENHVTRFSNGLYQVLKENNLLK